MNKVEKIKAEIKRRYNILKNVVSPKNKDYYDGKIEAYIETLDFLNSLKEPVSEDLEEACDKYYDETWDEHGGKAMVVDGCHDIWFPSQAIDDFFKAGAQWQKEKMMEDAVDGEIYFNMDYLQYHINTEPLTHFHHGDKVKLIIVKEE